MHMSDDDSGPEDGENEEDWKQEMAEHHNMAELTTQQLQQLDLRENIAPEWRSNEVRAYCCNQKITR